MSLCCAWKLKWDRDTFFTKASFCSPRELPTTWTFTVNSPSPWVVHKQSGRGSIPQGHRRQVATSSNISSIRMLCIIGIVNRARFNTLLTLLYYICEDEHPSQLFIMCNAHKRSTILIATTWHTRLPLREGVLLAPWLHQRSADTSMSCSGMFWTSDGHQFIIRSSVGWD